MSRSLAQGGRAHGCDQEIVDHVELRARLGRRFRCGYRRRLQGRQAIVRHGGEIALRISFEIGLEVGCDRAVLDRLPERELDLAVRVVSQPVPAQVLAAAGLRAPSLPASPPVLRQAAGSEREPAVTRSSSGWGRWRARIAARRQRRLARLHGWTPSAFCAG